MLVKIEDVVVPEIFTPIAQQMTMEKSALIQSGAMVMDSGLSAMLGGGGLTFNLPSYRDLENVDENISGDTEADKFTHDVPGDDSTPQKITSATEVTVRLSRNQSWASADLSAELSGNDPMGAIASRVSTYWARRLQAAFIASVSGVYADNAAAPTAAEHVQDDMSVNLAFDAAGAPIAYAAGSTDFSAGAFLDATLTMGDAMEGLSLVMVHSVVYNRMQKQNLIQFIPDARGETTFPSYLGRRIIIDDSLPSPDVGSYETWLFGGGALRMGQGTPMEATETERQPQSGNGGGSSILYNRVQWAIHPNGYRYMGTPPNGGPDNSATVGGLAHEDSWERVYSERKQIKMARLVTRES